MAHFLDASVTTDPELLQELKAAAKRGVTKEQIHSQRVSYIVGAMGDEKTVITTEMVERELERMSGEAA